MVQVAGHAKEKKSKYMVLKFVLEREADPYRVVIKRCFNCSMRYGQGAQSKELKQTSWRVTIE